MDRGYRVVPHKLRNLRGTRGWNQVKAANEMGINPALLNRIENGHVPSPQYATLEKMAEALGVSVDELVEPSEPGWPQAGFLGGFGRRTPLRGLTRRDAIPPEATRACAASRVRYVLSSRSSRALRGLCPGSQPRCPARNPDASSCL